MVLLVFGASSIVAEPATNPPVKMVTSVVGRRSVRDVVQTLEAVTRAVPEEAFGAGGQSSNTFWAEIVKQARVGGFTLDTNTESRFQGIATANDPRRVVPPEARSSPTTLWAYRLTLPHLITNKFAGFVPDSLAGVVWAGFHTNGRTTRVWSESRLPPGWPKVPPVLRWNTNNLMWGRKGMTAISEVAEDMGGFGQRQITALTRRHGYLRGHDMGPNGLQPSRVGRRVWFCTKDNQVIERKFKFLFVRRQAEPYYDYSIVLFDADLPPGIEPMRVANQDVLGRKYLHFLTYEDARQRPKFMSLQAGYVSADVPGWTVSIHGGDSGNPVMLLLPDELVFLNGITTSPPSAQMQADMDMLSRKASLDPSRYQMRWVNLDQYPDY